MGKDNIQQIVSDYDMKCQSYQKEKNKKEIYIGLPGY